jgi:hypothetical protein
MYESEEKTRVTMSPVNVELYFDEVSGYFRSEYMAKIFRFLEAERQRGNTQFLISMTERKKLTRAKEDEVIKQVRSIKPQAHGSIVTKGGRMLPLSGSKRLNLSNTPVLLVSNDEGQPVYVFPCLIGENYYDVAYGLGFLLAKLPQLPELPAGSEESIIRTIRENPSMLEEGLILLSTEVETSRGVADLLFSCESGMLLLVEVEREATDQTVGQVLRLCAGYEKQRGLAAGGVRAGIACLRMSENVEAAARRGGIEVFRVKPTGFE